MAFESVPTCTCTRPCAWWWSTVPRPFVPNTPLACASSTIMIAPNSSARAQSAGNGATSPSMLNTPSVTSSARGRDVLVREDLDRRATQAAAVDDAGVIECVRDDDIVLAEERRDRARVGREAALEDKGGLGLLERGEPRLELDAQRERPGDRADRARADAESSSGLDDPRDEQRVVRQAEVVVRGEVDDRSVVDVRSRPLSAIEHARRPEEAVASKGVQLTCEKIERITRRHVSLEGNVLAEILGRERGHQRVHLPQLVGRREEDDSQEPVRGRHAEP